MKTMSNLNEMQLADDSIVEQFRLLNGLPTNKQWQVLRAYVQQGLPEFWSFMEVKGARLREVEKDVCLLLRLGFPLKQIVRLTNVSYQNLNLMRKRLLRKLYGMEGYGRDFDAKIRVQGGGNHFV